MWGFSIAFQLTKQRAIERNGEMETRVGLQLYRYSS